MIISLKKEDILIYFGKMLPGINVEEVLVKKYDMKRDRGINYVDILSKEFLKNMFNSIEELNIESFFSRSVITSKTYKILDMIDMILLKKMEDFNFKNIVYKNDDEDNYYFEVCYDKDNWFYNLLW